MGMNGNLLVTSLDEMLVQGERLLACLSDQQYAQSCAIAGGATIGAHYRHNLEHFKTMFAAANQAMIDYDDRARDLRIESERAAALDMTRDFRHALRFLSPAQMEKPVRVQSRTSYVEAAPATAASTLEREIMYAISHCVHHYALIAMIAGIQDIALPDGFGVAPSTILHHQQKATA